MWHTTQCITAISVFLKKKVAISTHFIVFFCKKSKKVKKNCFERNIKYYFFLTIYSCSSYSLTTEKYFFIKNYREQRSKIRYYVFIKTKKK